MKTMLFTVLPDYYSSNVSSDEVYDLYVRLITNYLKENGTTCTVYINAGLFTYDDIDEKNPSYIVADKPDSEVYVNIAISGDAITGAAEKIDYFLSKAPIALYGIVDVEGRNMLTAETYDYLNHLSSAFTTITVKDYPDERIIQVQQSDVIRKNLLSDKESQCNADSF